MAFPERFLDELTERNDIVDVVSQYVRLTKKSGSNLFGLCPFHSEKTPSFSVAPDKQIYHCFGCGKGGGVINFIMEIENLSFPDAVAFLARRANMPLPEEAQSEDTSRRARLLELTRRGFSMICSSRRRAARRRTMSAAAPSLLRWSRASVSALRPIRGNRSRTPCAKRGTAIRRCSRRAS